MAMFLMSTKLSIQAPPVSAKLIEMSDSLYANTVLTIWGSAEYFGNKLVKSKKRTLGTKKLIKMKYDKMNYIEANPLDLL